MIAIVSKVLEKAPQSVRHDLAATDKIVRTRAEDALAAMIAAAMKEGMNL